jgi:hypothetical protein
MGLGRLDALVVQGWTPPHLQLVIATVTPAGCIALCKSVRAVPAINAFLSMPFSRFNCLISSLLSPLLHRELNE